MKVKRGGNDSTAGEKTSHSVGVVGTTETLSYGGEVLQQAL